MDLRGKWRELRGDTGAAAGVVLKRVEPDAACDLFVGVEKPGDLPCLVLEVAESAVPRTTHFPESRGFEVLVDRLQQPGVQARVRFRLRLLRREDEDVFCVLCGDVVEAVAGCSSQSDAVVSLASRLERWRRFLSRHGTGLSEEEQRGLFGELVFLCEFAMALLPARQALDAWKGPSAANQDFEFAAGAVEVKTSLAGPNQAIRISSVRQLDDIGLEALLLFFLPLDCHAESGQTLPGLVQELIDDLADDSDTLAAFGDRMLDAGYSEVHAQRYTTAYVQRSHSIFRVGEGFPRLLESGLPTGIGDVRYSIALSACAPFLVTDDAVSHVVKGARSAS